MKKYFDWFLSHGYWAGIGVFVATIGVGFTAATYFSSEEQKIGRAPENDAASLVMNCSEKEARCQVIIDLIKSKEAEVEKKSYIASQRFGPIRLNVDGLAGNTRTLSPDEKASEDEIKQLRDQIHELKNDLFQCERTDCSNHPEE